jgi:hypothetical protein
MSSAYWENGWISLSVSQQTLELFRLLRLTEMTWRFRLIYRSRVCVCVFRRYFSLDSTMPSSFRNLLNVRNSLDVFFFFLPLSGKAEHFLFKSFFIFVCVCTPLTRVFPSRWLCVAAGRPFYFTRSVSSSSLESTLFIDLSYFGRG